MIEDVSIKRSARIRRFFFFFFWRWQRFVLSAGHMWHQGGFGKQVKCGRHLTFPLVLPQKDFCKAASKFQPMKEPHAKCKMQKENLEWDSMNPCSNEWVCESVRGWSGKKHTAGLCRRQVQDPGGYHPKESCFFFGGNSTDSRETQAGTDCSQNHDVFSKGEVTRTKSPSCFEERWTGEWKIREKVYSA